MSALATEASAWLTAFVRWAWAVQGEEQGHVPLSHNEGDALPRAAGR